jgi:hypothetical protein
LVEPTVIGKVCERSPGRSGVAHRAVQQTANRAASVACKEQRPVEKPRCTRAVAGVRQVTDRSIIDVDLLQALAGEERDHIACLFPCRQAGAVGVCNRGCLLAVERAPPQSRRAVGRSDEDDLTFIRRDGPVEDLVARSELGAGGCAKREPQRRRRRRRRFAKMPDGGKSQTRDRSQRDREPGR